jgi:hypothetical protein
MEAARGVRPAGAEAAQRLRRSGRVCGCCSCTACAPRTGRPCARASASTSPTPGLSVNPGKAPGLEECCQELATRDDAFSRHSVRVRLGSINAA